MMSFSFFRLLIVYNSKTIRFRTKLLEIFFVQNDSNNLKKLCLRQKNYFSKFFKVFFDHGSFWHHTNCLQAAVFGYHSTKNPSRNISLGVRLQPGLIDMYFKLHSVQGYLTFQKFIDKIFRFRSHKNLPFYNFLKNNFFDILKTVHFGMISK